MANSTVLIGNGCHNFPRSLFHCHLKSIVEKLIQLENFKLTLKVVDIVRQELELHFPGICFQLNFEYKLLLVKNPRSSCIVKTSIFQAQTFDSCQSMDRYKHQIDLTSFFNYFGKLSKSIRP